MAEWESAALDRCLDKLVVHDTHQTQDYEQVIMDCLCGRYEKRLQALEKLFKLALVLVQQL